MTISIRSSCPNGESEPALASKFAAEVVIREGAFTVPFLLVVFLSRVSVSQQALLTRRGDQLAVGVVKSAVRQATPAGGVGAFHTVQEPVIGPKRPVEPHGVVQARAAYTGCLERQSVGQ